MSTDVVIEQPVVLDLLPTGDPSLSTGSDIPKVETKPDSQPAPEVKAKDEAAPVEGKKPADSAPAEQPEDTAANTEDEGKPKSKGVQKRIDELVKQREEEKAEKLRLLAIVEGYNKPKPEATPEDREQEPQKPLRETYASTDEYASALADYADLKAAWSAKQAVGAALAEEQRKAEVRQAEEARKATLDTYNGRVAKAAEKYSDYKQVAESPDVTVSMVMAQAIMQSEHGPELQYHLGKNPDEAKRISSLQPVQQLVELGVLAAKLTAVAPAPAVPAKPVSSAPKPIKPLESKAVPVTKSPEEETMEEYGARREREIREAKSRPGVRR